MLLLDLVKGTFRYVTTSGESRNYYGGNIALPAYDWSPDSQTLYFSKSRPESDSMRGIWQVGVDEHPGRPRVLFEDYKADQLRVSSSGRYLAFSCL